MERTQITPTFFVAGGVTSDDASEIAGTGVQMVIGAAPDRESTEPTDSDLMARHLAAQDVAFRHIPVVIGLITPEQISAFRAALDETDGPVLAYCHSGLRAALLWALARRDTLGDGVVIGLTAKAGFDIAPYLDDQMDALEAA